MKYFPLQGAKVKHYIQAFTGRHTNYEIFLVRLVLYVLLHNPFWKVTQTSNVVFSHVLVLCMHSTAILNKTLTVINHFDFNMLFITVKSDVVNIV